MSNQFNMLKSYKPHQWPNRLAHRLMTGTKTILMTGALIILPYTAMSVEMDLSALQLNGSASINNEVLRLTPAQPDQAGSAFTKNKLNINGGFSTFFNFQVTNPGAGGAADGLMFVVQPHGPDYIGNPSYALGFWDGTYDRKSVGVEIDTYKSGVWAGDNNDNHLAINTQGNLTGWAMARVEPSFQDDSLTWYAWIDYNGSQLEVRLNQTNQRPNSPYLSYPIDIQTLVGENDAFVGFTGGTGGAYANYDILSWQFVEKFAPIIPEVSGESCEQETAVCETDKQTLQQTLDDTQAKLAEAEKAKTECQAAQSSTVINKQFEVFARQNSISGGTGLDTGLQVSTGQHLVMTVDEEDTWKWAAGVNTSNANGSSAHPITKLGATFSVGTLVASLDGGKTFFRVGTNWNSTVPNDGVLSFYYWDSDSSNNSDSVTASVQVKSEQAQCQADKQALQQSLDETKTKLATCETAKTDTEAKLAEAEKAKAECQATQTSAEKPAYLGCFKDQGDPTSTKGRDLNGLMWSSSQMTTEKCLQHCQSQGYDYAGIQYSSQCFCGNTYGKSGTADNCNMPCKGNAKQICGGTWANSVYDLSGNE